MYDVYKVILNMVFGGNLGLEFVVVFVNYFYKLLVDVDGVKLSV